METVVVLIVLILLIGLPAFAAFKLPVRFAAILFPVLIGLGIYACYLVWRGIENCGTNDCAGGGFVIIFPMLWTAMIGVLGLVRIFVALQSRRNSQINDK